MNKTRRLRSYYASIDQQRLVVAQSTRRKFALRVSQLYEQGASLQRIGRSIRHWRCWTISNPSGISFRIEESTVVLTFLAAEQDDWHGANR